MIAEAQRVAEDRREEKQKDILRELCVAVRLCVVHFFFLFYPSSWSSCPSWYNSSSSSLRASADLCVSAFTFFPFVFFGVKMLYGKELRAEVFHGGHHQRAVQELIVHFAGRFRDEQAPVAGCAVQEPPFQRIRGVVLRAYGVV